MESGGPGAHQPVSVHDSESLIASIAGATADSRAGIFGPQSMSWKINRESALFLGAGRAALLQLAHPWVAAALDEHSSLMARPIARFHSTFRIVFTMVFGSLAQVTAAARHLYALHTRIEGKLPEGVGAFAHGSGYQANEVAALRWVYATLIESAVLAYGFVMPPLTPAELETYYAESKTLGALFGLPAAAMPSDWAAFTAYCRAMEESAQLGATATSRAMAQGLLAGAGSWIKPPRWYRALTASWLPERLQRDFELAGEDRDGRALNSAARWMPRVYSGLPDAARFVGPWHEAQARLAGRPPGPLTRASTRFWIGQARLPFA